MANIKISQLPAAITPLDGTEQLPLVQTGATKKISASNFAQVNNSNQILNTSGQILGGGAGGSVFATFSAAEAQRALDLVQSGLNKVLRHDTATYTLTGTTSANQNIIPALTILAGTMTANSVLRMEICIEYSNNTNSKAFSAYIGATRWGAGADINRTSATAYADVRGYALVNKGVLNSNLDLYYGGVGPVASMNAAPLVHSINFAIDQTLTFVGTLANSADFIRVPYHKVWVENV